MTDEDRSVAAVLDALRAGRVAVSASPDSPVLVRRDGVLIAVDADGCRLERAESADGLSRLVDESDGRVAAISH